MICLFVQVGKLIECLDLFDGNDFWRKTAEYVGGKFNSGDKCRAKYKGLFYRAKKMQQAHIPWTINEVHIVLVYFNIFSYLIFILF